MNELSKAAALMGKKGGEAGVGQAKARTSQQASHAAHVRWKRYKGNSVSECFWEKVDKKGPDECWPWLAATDKDGYGRFRYKGSCRFASRVAYELTFGLFDKSLDCCHTCDNPPCCNPKHLFLGTAKDNIIDAVAKGRMDFGEKSVFAKMNDSKVIEIRRLFDSGLHTNAQLSRMFKFSQMGMWQIVHRKTWKHIP